MHADADPAVSGLAGQLPTLTIAARCQCGDSFCATFYAVADPPRPFPPDSDTLVLDPYRGMINIDVDPEGTILEVEVLYREDLKAVLDRLQPIV
jgi:hypothetical protein